MGSKVSGNPGFNFPRIIRTATWILRNFQEVRPVWPNKKGCFKCHPHQFTWARITWLTSNCSSFQTPMAYSQWNQPQGLDDTWSPITSFETSWLVLHTAYAIADVNHSTYESGPKETSSANWIMPRTKNFLEIFSLRAKREIHIMKC